MILGTHIRPVESEGSARLDELAAAVFPQLPTRASARKAARRGELWVEDAPRHGGWWVKPGERVSLHEGARPVPAAFPLRLEVVHEDAHLVVVVKPPGILTTGARHRTVEHALIGVPVERLAPSPEPDALRWPRPAHRLDAPTGGLLLCAKTASALAGLAEAFHRREVVKRYRAIVIGRLDGSGVVDREVEGRPAVTRWEAVRHDRSVRSAWITTVDLWPATGRTHQLRRHLSALGHPVLGDPAYGLEGLILRGKGLFLWAAELRLRHPILGEPLAFAAAEPPKFEALRAREARRAAALGSAEGGRWTPAPDPR